MNNTFTIELPPTPENESNTVLEDTRSTVIVGANGAGKTRLGTWLELSAHRTSACIRIAAQRSIKFPQNIHPRSVDKTRSDLQFGAEVQFAAKVQDRLNSLFRNRYNSNPAINAPDDFKKLLDYLFSEAAEVNAHYRQKSITTPGTDRIQVPDTKLDKTKGIWEAVLPHRNLVIGGGNVKVGDFTSDDTYSPVQLSDGERVIFYVAAQSMSAPENALIIIDEPEIHLNRAIQYKLYDAIEAARADCRFVYLTHDLDFAVSRTSAKKVWINSYEHGKAGSRYISADNFESGSRWDWQLIPDGTDLPEEAVFTILGSRQPVLFIEGDKSSYDFFIYSQLYADYTVIPRGSCDEVIRSVKAMKSLQGLQRTVTCEGIVDRDHRTAETIGALESKGVHVTDVSEVENLLLLEAVLESLENHQKYTEADSKIDAVKTMVFGKLEREKLFVVSAAATARVNDAIKRPKPTNGDKETFLDNVSAAFEDVKAEDIYDAVLTEVDEILSTRNYEAALRMFNQKSLLNKAAELYGMTKNGFIDLVRRLLSSEDGEDLKNALTLALPSLPQRLEN